MGSSPVTATIPPAREQLASHLRRTLGGLGVSSDQPLLIAFSGGVDSTALLLGLLAWRGCHGSTLLAAHLDHAADEGSAERADAAREIVGQLAVGFVRHRLEPAAAQGKRGPEAAAREARYRWLEEQRAASGCRFILTAHHADDQRETVLLRMLYGTRLYGLAAMQPQRGRILRPLLDVRRSTLARVVVESGRMPLSDPGNSDLRRPRNRLRQLVLPALSATEPGIGQKLLTLARRAAAARRRIDALLLEALRPLAGPGTVDIGLTSLAALPSELRQTAVDLLNRLAGRPFPPRSRAVAELLRQVTADRAVLCDAGGNWRWRSYGSILRLERRPTPTSAFAYTFEAPGTAILPEIDRRITVTKAPKGPWVFERSSHLGALDLRAVPAGQWQVRNRRPGDRIQPLGSSHERKVKDVLIDLKIPREHRDALPLVIVDGRIAWIPGVVTDHRRRVLEDADEVWRIEVSPS